jgi:hypothetical protein
MPGPRRISSTGSRQYTVAARFFSGPEEAHVALKPGECVRVPDGRPGRIRGRRGGKLTVRVRRRGGTADEVLLLSPRELERIDPPAGWMSVKGYVRRTAAARRNARARRGAARDA